MRILLSIFILLVITLLGCNSNTSTTAVVTSTQPVANTVSQQEIDQPRLTGDEAVSLIFSSVTSKLPGQYKLEQFDLNTRNVRYAGKGKWEFTMQGAGKKVTELPDEKVEKTAILWVYMKQEMVTTYDLSLAADYFENTGICEIKYINKTNEITSTNIVSAREIEAKLKVKLMKLEYFGNRLQVQITLENAGYVPITGIAMNIEYDKPVKEVSSKNFDGVLLPEKTAVLLKLYEDENIRDFGYPDDISFTTGVNTDIPFSIDVNAFNS